MWGQEDGDVINIDLKKVKLIKTEWGAEKNWKFVSDKG